MERSTFLFYGTVELYARPVTAAAVDDKRRSLQFLCYAFFAELRSAYYNLSAELRSAYYIFVSSIVQPSASVV
jgi:hypothetical protein